MSFEYTCPYCAKSIAVDPSSPPQPKFENSKEQVSYNKRRRELQKRDKECFVCPQCNGELVVFSGKLFKYNEFSQELYNKIFCSFCGKEANFDSCYKEIKGTAVGYTFYCKGCGRKNTIRWAVLIVFIFIISLIILLFV